MSVTLFQRIVATSGRVCWTPMGMGAFVAAAPLSMAAKHTARSGCESAAQYQATSAFCIVVITESV